METKALRISDGNLQNLTFEQVYCKYTPLIRSKACGWISRYEYDEMFQLAAIALWEAYCKYDVDKSEITFGHFAGVVIDNKLLSHYSKLRNRARKITFISLNAPISDEDGTELQELIGEEETYTAEVADKVLFTKLMNQLSIKQKHDVQCIIDGLKQCEIASLNNTPVKNTSDRIKTAMRKLKRLYLWEMGGV